MTKSIFDTCSICENRLRNKIKEVKDYFGNKTNKRRMKMTKKKEKKIQVIEWTSTDPTSVYRLDEPGEGNRFFKDLLMNAETDGREEFAIAEYSKKEWDECVQNGLDDA